MLLTSWLSGVRVLSRRARRRRDRRQRDGISIVPAAVQSLEDRVLLTITNPEVQKLLASDASDEDRFGYSVAVHEDRAIVGAYLDDAQGDASGSAYIFERVNGVWTEQTKLIGSDIADGYQFGFSVDIHEDTAIVGAFSSDSSVGGGGSNVGAAYIFFNDGSGWAEQDKIGAADFDDEDWFGYSVAVDEDTAIVGAYKDDDNGTNSGSVYAYTRTMGSWTQQAKITPTDADAFDQFGYSVDLQGDTTLIGAYTDDDGGRDAGAAYVFTRTGSVWTQQDKFTSNDSANHDWFGFDVALDGDTAVVSAYLDDDNGASSGSAYAFTRSGNTWSQQAKFTADDGRPGDRFGASVSVSGDTAIVGSALHDGSATHTGAAYVYERTGNSWNQAAKLTASDEAESNQFGRGVAVFEDTAFIGSYLEDEEADDAGAVYVYEDRPVIDLTVSPASGSEAAMTAITVTATTNKPVSGVQTANLVVGGTDITLGDYTLSNGTFTFPDGGTTASLTFTIQDDFIDEALVETALLSLTSLTSGLGLGPNSTATIDIQDDDTNGITVTESDGDTIVHESGTMDSFAVVLDAQPLGDVVLTVDLPVPDPMELTRDKTTLTFTPGNWNSSQVVTVTGLDDPLVDGDQTTDVAIRVDTAASHMAWMNVPDEVVPVVTIDDETAGYTVTITDSDTVVSENGTTDTFSVVLDAAPVSSVVIVVTPSDPSEVSADTTALAFDSTNWDTAQVVTLTGIDDPTLDGDINSLVNLSINDAVSDDAFDNLPDQQVAVTTLDNDVAGITVVESGGSTIVDESGTTDSFTVVLEAQPLSNVVLTVTSDDVGEATVDKSVLTFTPATWNLIQTVTVMGIDDPAVDGDQSSTVTISVDDANSNDEYDPVSDLPIAVTTTDDDVAGYTITETGGGTSVNESGTSDTFDVVLDAQPLSDVVFTVTSGDTGEATVDMASLTFTPSNWASAQTLTVMGIDDPTVDGDQITPVTLSIDDASSDDAFDPLGDQSVSVTTVDNDVAGFTVTETGGDTTVNESGTTDTFSVVLDAQPLSDVVFSLSASDTGEATIDSSTLTFTPANWNTGQDVTVTGIDDNLSDGDQTSTVTLTIDDANSDDAFDPLSDQTVTVTTIDNDLAGFTVIETSGSTVVSESGSLDVFSVLLNIQPASDVVIDIANPDTGEAQISLSSLTFTPSNWDLPQMPVVTGVDDPTVDGDQTTPLTLSINDALSDDAFDSVPDQNLNVVTLDDDTAGFSITFGNGTVSETGTTDTFSVVLTAQPLSDVVFDVASSDTGEAVVDMATLTFTPANWDAGQDVTVTGVDDPTVDGPQTSTISVAVNNGQSDDAFDNLSDSFTMVTTDDDVAGYSVTETGGSTTVTEAGSTDTFSVILDAQPLSDVVLTVTSADTGEAVVDMASLTFSPANWNTQQVVTVTGVDDTVLDGDRMTAITLSIDDASSDDAFDPLGDQTVTVTTTDDEVAGITVTESGGSTVVSETGTTDTFTVVLDVEPLSDVVLDIANPDTSEVTVDAASLTFTPSDWNSPQTVTVTGVDDALPDGDQMTDLTISVDDANSDDGYDPVGDSTVTATTTDDDVFSLRFDMGRDPAQVANGYTEVTDSTNYTSARGFGITGGGPRGIDRTGTDPLTRDALFTRTADFFDFRADLPNGTYNVTFGVGDAYAKSGIGLSAEGQLLDTVNTPIGQVLAFTHTVTVADGNLDVRIEKLGVTIAVLNYLEIVQTAPGRPSVEFALVSSGVGEDVGSYTIEARLSAARPGPVTVPLSLSGSATPGAGNDYTLSANSITIPAGQMTGTVTVTVNDDSATEGPETIILTMGTPSDSGVDLGNRTVHTSTIADNDGLIRRFDMGRTLDHVESGYTGVTPGSVYNSTDGFGITAGDVRGLDRTGGSDRDRDSIFTKNTDFFEFGVDLPTGTYQVTVGIGDAYAKNDIGITLEGTLVDTVSTGPGVVQGFTFNVSVTDGRLEVRLDEFGNTIAVLNYLDIIQL